MINEYCAKSYCCEDLSLIENYSLAVADTTQTWICHHILGEQHSRQYLIDNNLYESRPANELRFVTHADHQSLHHKGVSLSEEHKKAIGEAHKGVPLSEEHKKAIGEANSKKILQYTKSGEFVREWSSMTAIWQELSIRQSNICACCNSKRKSAGGYVWKYAV